MAALTLGTITLKRSCDADGPTSAVTIDAVLDTIAAYPADVLVLHAGESWNSDGWSRWWYALRRLSRLLPAGQNYLGFPMAAGNTQNQTALLVNSGVVEPLRWFDSRPRQRRGWLHARTGGTDLWLRSVHLSDESGTQRLAQAHRLAWAAQADAIAVGEFNCTSSGPHEQVLDLRQIAQRSPWALGQFAYQPHPGAAWQMDTRALDHLVGYHDGATRGHGSGWLDLGETAGDLTATRAEPGALRTSRILTSQRLRAGIESYKVWPPGGASSAVNRYVTAGISW